MSEQAQTNAAEWAIDECGNLVVSVSEAYRRELSAQLWDEDGEELHSSPGDIEYEFYGPMFEGTDLEFFASGDAPVEVGMWGGPVILEGIERDGDYLTWTGRMWTDHSYALYNSPAGMDTLAKTGRAVWALVPQTNGV